jgi:hypothetical protein
MLFSRRRFQIVYVNVTCCFREEVFKLFMWMLHGVFEKKFSNSLCKCYMMFSRRSSQFLFMWMLRDVFEKKFSNCLCECYMMFSRRSSQIYFMWMLHGVFEKKFSSCLCECYMMFSRRSFQIVYVNVTCCFREEVSK